MVKSKNVTFDELQGHVKALQQRVTALEKEIEALRSSVVEEVILLRSITKEQAKEEIKNLFESGETLYYSDIARRLKIDLPLVAEICQELQEEGEIKVDANAV